MQTTAADSLVGRSLEGRYRILERIARGGMSTVYAAVDERLDRLVAVKVMSPALSADPAFSDRFAREARAAARLTHLNAVSVYDQGHEVSAAGHHVFLVMELVEGRTLRELLRERGRLGTADAVSIMEPVLSALSAAHRAGLVHRDVKPENILLSDDGVVKVVDFGLARAVESDVASTRTGLMMGTVAYCAPEQIASGTSDPRSDVYSAGVVLFELLTGELPYRGESAMNVAYQHVHSRVPAPSSRVRPAGGIPNEIDELVISATDSDPTGRPSDAGAFLAEIADVRAALGLPVIPVPARTRSRGTRTAPDRQHRPPDAATTAAIRGGSGQHDTAVDPHGPRAARYDGHQYTGQRITTPERRSRPAPPPPVVISPARGQRMSRRRGRRRALIVLLVVLLIGAAAGYASWYFAAGRYSQVPQLRGATQSSAVGQLKNAGYRVHVQPGPQFDDKVAKGRVLGTDPAAQTRAIRGANIVIILSAGPHFYLVKPVRGQNPDEARATLLTAGRLTVAEQVTPEPSDTVPVNQVTRTSPTSGTQVRANQLITIYVSSGPPFIDVPTVSPGMQVGAAQSVLRKAHFKTRTDSQYSDSFGTGEVISIDPSSDRAQKFSTITITVSKGPEMVIVPDLPPGTSVTDARSALVSAGLKPVVKVYLGAVGSPSTVIAVSPRPGTSVHAGSAVTVYAIAD